MQLKILVKNKILDFRCRIGWHFLEFVKEDPLDWYWIRETYKCKRCKKIVFKDYMNI